VERRRVRGRGRGEGERRVASPFAPNYAGKAPGDHTKHLCNNIAEVFRVVALSFEHFANFAAPPKVGVGTQRSAAHKQARRMVARATGRSSPSPAPPTRPRDTGARTLPTPPSPVGVRCHAPSAPMVRHSYATLRPSCRLQVAPAADPGGRDSRESIHGPVLEFPLNTPRVSQWHHSVSNRWDSYGICLWHANGLRNITVRRNGPRR